LEKESKFELGQLLWAPNLLSLSRLIIAPIIGFFLWRGDQTSTLICLVLLTLAGITDFLDGWLARKLGKVSPLGIALDPLADKVLAVILIVELIFFRDFPVWLALLIIGRDFLIVIFGLIIMRDNKITLPSNITGKYYFAAIVVLIASYIMNFDFGCLLMKTIVLTLFLLSGIFYGERFVAIRNHRDRAGFIDRAAFRLFRTAVTLIVSVVYLVKLYVDIIGPGLN
jgi:CDP-diacylglycerol--glycerol-3-phosphate 3-phosphatidyltransferase